MNHKRLAFTAASVALFAVGFFTTKYARSQGLITPNFVGHTINYEYVNHFNQITNIETDARRRDGSLFRTGKNMLVPDTGVPDETQIVRLDTGYNIMIDPYAKKMIHFPLSLARFTFYQFKPKSCVDALFLDKGDTYTCESTPSQTRFGRPVIAATKRHIDYNKSLKEDTYLFDPGLDYDVIENVSVIKGLSFTKRATSLVIADPRDELFQEPVSFTESPTPSNYLLTFGGLRGKKKPSQLRLDALDEQHAKAAQ